MVEHESFDWDIEGSGGNHRRGRRFPVQPEFWFELEIPIVHENKLVEFSRKDCLQRCCDSCTDHIHYSALEENLEDGGQVSPETTSNMYLYIVPIDVNKHVHSVDLDKLSDRSVGFCLVLHFKLQSKTDLNSVHVDFDVAVCVHEGCDVVVELVRPELGRQFVAVQH